MKRLILKIVEGKLTLKVTEKFVKVDPTSGLVIVNNEPTQPVTSEQLNRVYGFGGFMLNLTPDQIEFDQTVLDFISPSIDRRDPANGNIFALKYQIAPEANDKLFHSPYMVIVSEFAFSDLSPEKLGIIDISIDRKCFKLMEKTLNVTTT